MKFDFETLVLLIGTNPLPNYVAAEFFLKNNQNLKNIFLMHSGKGDFQEGTGHLAENLEYVLKKKEYSKNLKFPLEKIALSDVGNAAKTWNDLEEYFVPEFKELKNKHSLHLNYTGGTKVMGVHVYRFIENKMNELVNRKLNSSFSYFDGRRFKIIDDSSNSYMSNDLRYETDIYFQDIIELHGFNWKNKPDLSVISTSAMDQLQNKIDTGEIDDLKDDIKNFYEKFKKIELKEIEEKNGHPRKVPVNIDDLGLDQFEGSPLFNVIRAMPGNFQFLDERGRFDSSKLEENHGSFLNFLNGIWLEHYVYRLLQNGLGNEREISIEKDWKIHKRGWSNYFQLDVILKKGFQLVGLSCTTTKDKSACKSRGFEVIHRTRQMGGDESKAIVVTLMDDNITKILQDELEKDSGCREGHVKVFGKKDLESTYFLKKMKEFIK